MKITADKELRRCRELINTIKKAILITRSKDKILKGRPMITANIDEECNTWFFTNHNAEKLRQIAENNEVFLVYSDSAANSFVTVRGNIIVDEDKERAIELWNPSIGQWLPHGCESSDILLLKVLPEEIEYWDGSPDKFSILFQMFSGLVAREHSDNLLHQFNDIGSFKK